jgi:hypothetical protein
MDKNQRPVAVLVSMFSRKETRLIRRCSRTPVVSRRLSNDRVMRLNSATTRITRTDVFHQLVSAGVIHTRANIRRSRATWTSKVGSIASVSSRRASVMQRSRDKTIRGLRASVSSRANSRGFVTMVGWAAHGDDRPEGRGVAIVSNARLKTTRSQCRRVEYES